jgi:hypothetical protein
MDMACIGDDHQRNSFQRYAEGKKTIQVNGIAFLLLPFS